MTRFRHLRRLAEEDGATMVEYAMMTVLIAAVCAGIVAILGQDVMALFVRVPRF